MVDRRGFGVGARSLPQVGWAHNRPRSESQRRASGWPGMPTRSALVFVSLAALACVDSSVDAGAESDLESDLDSGWGEPEPEPIPCTDDNDCEALGPAGLCVEALCHAVDRQPFDDAWREELVLPAAAFDRLIVGGTRTGDNFDNQGDLEVRAVEGVDTITVELRRFTVATNLHDAELSLTRMHLWAYALAEPTTPRPELDVDACATTQARFCHLRAWYDGPLQPVRDGADIRVTVPAGWPGALELETRDNLGETGFPQRSDVTVDGHAGDLSARLGSGRAQIRLAREFPHYPGCALESECVAAGFNPDCGCEGFARIDVRAHEGEAADITVDAPASLTSFAVLHEFLPPEDPEPWPGCAVEIACEDFDACALDPATASTPATARAAINYPAGVDPRGPELGVGITVVSHDCRTVEVADGLGDWVYGPSSERRGNLRLCSGCLD